MSASQRHSLRTVSAGNRSANIGAPSQVRSKQPRRLYRRARRAGLPRAPPPRLAAATMFTESEEDPPLKYGMGGGNEICVTTIDDSLKACSCRKRRFEIYLLILCGGQFASDVANIMLLTFVAPCVAADWESSGTASAALTTSARAPRAPRRDAAPRASRRVPRSSSGSSSAPCSGATSPTPTAGGRPSCSRRPSSPRSGY